MEFLLNIWNGTCFEDTSHFMEIKNKFLKNISIVSTGEIVIEPEIRQCLTEMDLITLFKQHFQWEDIPANLLQRFQKSSEISGKLREKANEAYKSGDMVKALRGYNLALAFAPKDSVELGLAYGNRSALFAQTGEYELAIRDIYLAVGNNFPKTLRDILQQRRDKCLDAIIEANKTQENDPKTSIKDFCNNNFFTLKNPGAKIVTAEDWVEVEYSNEFGRRLVVKQDVPAGSLILMDKPFVSVLSNLLTWDSTHCHYCYKKFSAVVPCEECTFAFYCNPTCRKNAARLNHKHEDNYLSYLHHLSRSIIGHRDIQTLRILSQIGPEKLLTLQNTIQFETLNDSSSISGFDPDGSYDSSSYLAIFSLVSHFTNPNYNLKEKVEESFKAIFLTQLMKHQTSFFETIPQDNLDAFEEFIAAVILRHLGNIKFNAISTSELKTGVSGDYSFGFATAVYPLISLCNHSCDPSAAPVKKMEFLETSLIALKNLQPGDEVSITYKPLFTSQKRHERKEYLEERYCFQCSCPPCQLDWGPKSIRFDDDLATEFELNSNCRDCRRLKKRKKKWRKNETPKPCELCIRSHLEQVSKVDDFEQLLRQADKMIKKGETDKLIQSYEMLLKCLLYFTSSFSPCYSLYQVCLDLYKKCLVKLVNSAF